MKTTILIIMLAFGMTAFCQETPTMSYRCFPVTTNGGYDGHIDQLTVSGGLPPYTYQWSNGQTTASITGLQAGTYSVTLTDHQGYFAFGDGLVEVQPPQSSGMYLDLKTATCYDFTTDKIMVPVVKASLIPVPIEYKQLCKVSLKGATSGHIDLRLNNGLTRWVKVQK